MLDKGGGSVETATQPEGKAKGKVGKGDGKEFGIEYMPVKSKKPKAKAKRKRVKRDKNYGPY